MLRLLSSVGYVTVAWDLYNQSGTHYLFSMTIVNHLLISLRGHSDGHDTVLIL